MLTEKKETLAKLETKLQRLDKDIQTKKEVSSNEVYRLRTRCFSFGYVMCL